MMKDVRMKMGWECEKRINEGECEKELRWWMKMVNGLMKNQWKMNENNKWSIDKYEEDKWMADDQTRIKGKIKNSIDFFKKIQNIVWEIDFIFRENG